MQSVLENTTKSFSLLNGRAINQSGKPHAIRWTVDEYYQMYELGLFYGRKVELIKGEIVERPKLTPPHATSILLVNRVLHDIFIRDFDIRMQMPVTFSKLDEAEPDVAVVKGSIRDFTNAHPTTAVLLVEIAFHSLRFARTNKMRLYAENRIEDYWIVNLKHRQLEVFRKPFFTDDDGFDYAEKLKFGENETVSPIAKPEAYIKVADLLP